MKSLVAPGAAAALAAVLAIGHGIALASSSKGAHRPEREPAVFSPLFARRLEVGLENMDRPRERVHVARLGLVHQDDDPVEGGILSAQPFSFCLGSACYTSGCLGSACVGSGCLGSACTSSQCAGSTCFGSVCGASGCLGSTCLGSACLGSVCVGSACLNCPKV